MKRLESLQSAFFQILPASGSEIFFSSEHSQKIWIHEEVQYTHPKATGAEKRDKNRITGDILIIAPPPR